MWQVKKDSMCGQCQIKDTCRTTNIPDDAIFIKMVTGEKFAFVHDTAECGGLFEVEEMPQGNMPE